MVVAVSVCIPTYKGAHQLAATIDSVLSQTFGDFELLIIDDNSPDKTAEVVAGFADPRIRYLRNSVNLGPQGNWNRCLAESRGRYFKLLPQDDLLATTCLEKQVAVLERDKPQRIALVFSARSILVSDGKVATVRGYPGGREGELSAEGVIGRCVRFGTNLIGEPGAVLMRKALTGRVGEFDATNPYVVDLDYWFRLLNCGTAYYFPSPLVTFRVSLTSWSFAIGSNQSTDFVQFVERMAPKFPNSIRRRDIVIGRMMAKVNNILRLLFYKLYLKR
jgi:glycosyltransferase involved in cell wall biosynthesis